MELLPVRIETAACKEFQSLNFRYMKTHVKQKRSQNRYGDNWDSCLRARELFIWIHFSLGQLVPHIFLNDFYIHTWYAVIIALVFVSRLHILAMSDHEMRSRHGLITKYCWRKVLSKAKIPLIDWIQTIYKYHGFNDLKKLNLKDFSWMATRPYT